MSRQGRLFRNDGPQWLGHARRGDPDTSKMAAASVKQKLGDLQAEVLRMIRRHPGKTCSELAHYERIRDPRKIGRRLGELETRGLVKRWPPRPCSITKKKAATWTAEG